MRVILTRPQAQSAQWLAALQAAGLHGVSWPLIDIRPTRNLGALMAAQEATLSYQALMFVSANAVEYFLAPNSPLTQEERAQNAIISAAKQSLGPRCWATGSGTVQALLRAGVPLRQIDAPAVGEVAESESLWRQVQGQVHANSRVLIVRGADAQGQLAGRPWLAEQLSQVGAHVEQVAAYERHPPQWSAAQLAQAQTALQDGSVWVFSSSEALHHLPALPAQQARAVATHPRIAQAARDRGFAHVRESAPEPAALVRSIQSFA